MCLNFKCIRLGFQDRRHRLRSRPMYVLFRYGIQTFYTAIIIIIIVINTAEAAHGYVCTYTA